jgi:hypothetical protein
MPNSSNILSTSPTKPEHMWYYDANANVPMDHPESSEPTSNTTDNSILSYILLLPLCLQSDVCISTTS